MVRQLQHTTTQGTTIAATTTHGTTTAAKTIQGTTTAATTTHGTTTAAKTIQDTATAATTTQGIDNLCYDHSRYDCSYDPRSTPQSYAGRLLRHVQHALCSLTH